MRLYRFFSAEYGMCSILDRQIRIGRIEELNDDFEFIGVALSEKAERLALRNMRQRLSITKGVICMSKKWESPLMWAHYANSHKGIVLGFDVPDETFYKVCYVKKRPTLGDMGLSILGDITPEGMKRMILTKAAGWAYEQEYRAYVELNDGIEINDEVHYFMPFSENMKLREVIVGSRYKGPRAEMVAAVNDPSVDVYMARGSFEKFKMVRQRQKSMWP
ncbi:DUF2971 domain-containing protein [Oceanibaculum indicum]|uniref:DUF2971 domain-containing protein n=1 Tax=Oceanibaculum indicum P24 TaxID=1207063 RepID=K2J589_9PROT|nr:DUF2971 domain-containing protein [Oceanibaculum indicum]EKE70188.1 hypothetical protein P24_15906 [Oceanibaculum indicum P24]